MDANLERYKELADCCTVAWRIFPRKERIVAGNYCRFLLSLVGSDGPGQQYAKVPRIQRSKTRILVTQIRGLDV